MKKLIINAFVAAVAIIASASVCNAQVRQYTHDMVAFTSIDASADFEVSVQQGISYQVVLTIDEPYKDYVTCSVNNQVLTIGVDDKKVPKEVKALYKGKTSVQPTFKAMVYLPADYRIRAINLSDKAVYYDYMEGPIAGDVVVNVTDNAMVKALTVSAPAVTVNADKRANVTLTSNCDEVSIKMNGNAIANITEHLASKTGVALSNAANLTCFLDTDALNFEAKATAKAALNGRADKAVYDCAASSVTNASNLVNKEAKVTMSSLCNLTVAASDFLKVENLNGGATLNFSGSPVIEVGSITKSTMTSVK